MSDRGQDVPAWFGPTVLVEWLAAALAAATAITV